MKIILFILLLVLTGSIIYLWMFFGRKLRAMQDKIELVATDVTRLRKDIRAIGSGAIGVGQRVISLEEYMQNIYNRQEKNEKRISANSSYSYAAKLFSMGSSMEEVMQSCGISKAEAHLLEVMHKNSSESKSLP